MCFVRLLFDGVIGYFLMVFSVLVLVDRYMKKCQLIKKEKKGSILEIGVAVKVCSVQLKMPPAKVKVKT